MAMSGTLAFERLCARRLESLLLDGGALSGEKKQHRRQRRTDAKQFRALVGETIGGFQQSLRCHETTPRSEPLVLLVVL